MEPFLREPSTRVLLQLMDETERLRFAPFVRAVETAKKAYALGADQQLEACRTWLHEQPWLNVSSSRLAEDLLAAMRPNEQSPAEQALTALGPEPLPETGPTGDVILNMGSIQRHRRIRTALDRLKELEGQQ